MTETTLETKMVSDDFAATFAAFRDANDARLAEIEQKSTVDPLLDAKVDRINKRLDTLSISLSQTTVPTLPDETKSAWSRFIRSGDDRALTELKSLSSTDGDGGYVAPVETESRIDTALAQASPLRRIATVRKIGSARFRKPVGMTEAGSGWAGETTPRIETVTPDLKILEFPVGELYAMPAATQALLDDSVADVDAWLAEEVRDVFAAQETQAFISGDGVNKPKGFLAYQGGAQALTEVDGPSATALGMDDVMDLIHAPLSRYRDNASFVMNRKTLGEIRKIKDADGNYIWQPSLAAGQPSSLMGYAVVEAEDMPDIGASTTPIAFGDFRRGYLITDRQGVRVLRDPYSAKPYVLFYTTKRVGGGVQDSQAISLLRMAA